MAKPAQSIPDYTSIPGVHGVGGTLARRRQPGTAILLSAYTGLSRFPTTRWIECRKPFWVVDLLHQGRQRQRIGRGRPFDRLSGVAALYAPGCDYREWQVAGETVDESWITFDLRGPLAKLARPLVGAAGYCHFLDPDAVLAHELRAVGGLLFQRRPGFHVRAQGLLLGLLGHLLAAEIVAARRRVVRDVDAARPATDLRERVEQHIREQIAAPLHVDDLTRHLGMSRSVLAHRYPRLAGESPYRTIQRLKVEAAKRLLLGDGLTVKECAARLGFSTEFHFSRLFKRLEGLAPQNYRQALAKGRR